MYCYGNVKFFIVTKNKIMSNANTNTPLVTMQHEKVEPVPYKLRDRAMIFLSSPARRDWSWGPPKADKFGLARLWRGREKTP